MEEKKNVIAHVLNTNSYSGAENVVMQIIEGTKEEYHGVYVTKNGPIVKMLQDRKIDYYLIPDLKPKEIRKMCEDIKPAVIHAHDFTAGCVCAMSHVKVPIISHLHNNPLWIQKLHPYSIFYFLCARKFQKILVVSDAVEKEYIFSKFLKEKFISMGNPISRDKILSRVNKEDYEKKYDIACVARITQQKNPKRFLEIVQKMKDKKPDIKCVWIGDGELKEEVLNQARKLQVSGNVHFIGFQENPYTILAGAKAFMLTSSWEGFGLVAFEALTLGLPCFVSKVGGLTGIVNDTCGKLCETDDDFLSLLEVLENQEQYQKLSKGALERASKIENTKEYMEKMKKIYQKG